MDSILTAAPAEQLRLEFTPMPAAPPRPRARRRSPHRDWARRERQAYEALQHARESGDLQLIERARRAYAESWRRRP